MRALQKACGLYGIFPSSFSISNPLSKPHPQAIASGGSPCVREVKIGKNQNTDFVVESHCTHEQDPIDEREKVRRFREM